jgi:hypothetical protein
MLPDRPLRYAQRATNGPCLELGESSPHPTTLFKVHLTSTLPYVPGSLHLSPSFGISHQSLYAFHLSPIRATWLTHTRIVILIISGEWQTKTRIRWQYCIFVTVKQKGQYIQPALTKGVQLLIVDKFTAVSVVAFVRESKKIHVLVQDTLWNVIDSQELSRVLQLWGAALSNKNNVKQNTFLWWI